MADAVTSQIIQDDNRNAVLKFTNISDGSGESAVTKIDVSALQANSRGDSCTEVAISKIWWQCVGMGVQLLNDATTDTLIIALSPSRYTRTSTIGLGSFSSMACVAFLTRLVIIRISCVRSMRVMI